MSGADDFFDGLKTNGDRVKEWADAAQFYVDIRRTGEPEVVEPSEESPVEKVSADLRAVGRGALKLLKKFEPTGLANAMSTKPGAIAGLSGAVLFGLGTGLQSRGRKELGGQSRTEHAMMGAKKLREGRPESSSFVGKLRDNVSDFTAGLASTARKHPVKAGLLGAFGGAKAGTTLLSKLTRKVP